MKLMSSEHCFSVAFMRIYSDDFPFLEYDVVSLSLDFVKIYSIHISYLTWKCPQTIRCVDLVSNDCEKAFNSQNILNHSYCNTDKTFSVL